ncbi:unnamed protein product [Eruca vesicaria subsp. sativa]|uniref:Small ribosomal subunit protein uS15c n=1 Tax=Eruca vesicaria subsp. sativa TaxID=29727 RepID=A0ABC8KA80_ERUVS|nr:unnamed protein product [Eruca vesicaria subsp. sativa]
MALHLARRKQRLHSNPSLIHLFSTSSSPPQDGNESGEQPPSDFKISSYFSGIKSSLKQQSHDGRRQLTRSDDKAQSFSGGDFQDVRRNLNEFRLRSAPPPPPARGLQDLYKQTVLSKPKLESSSFENLKQNLRQMRPQANAETRWSNLSSLQGIMKTKHNVRSNVFGGGEGLPISVFGEELEERRKKGDETEGMKSEFIKRYNTEELGEMLRKYRPEGKKEDGWFSLQELNQRLVKLREVEEEAAQGTRRGLPFDELRTGIQQSREAEARKALAFQNVDIFSVFSDTPKYLLEPPKEELVQTYFHPDNMSSAEKMKIELAKVREEFKMSESDCGSARVQVAQLTTKIKHLSSVLHKKDKHSKKGLIAMVHRRKKLLKYMRRTDWDSYCLSLSKLGLRDNPDYKF